MVRTIACTTQLGSISSLRCQKSRRARPGRTAPCEVMFSRTIFWLVGLLAIGLAIIGRPSFALSSYGAAAYRYQQPIATKGLAEPKLASPARAGGARRDRTDDLMLAKHALSQLSYGPVPEHEGLLACRAEARPTARRRRLGSGATALARCASEGWWAWEDLNFRPHAYQARALTN